MISKDSPPNSARHEEPQLRPLPIMMTSKRKVLEKKSIGATTAKGGRSLPTRSKAVKVSSSHPIGFTTMFHVQYVIMTSLEQIRFKGPSI
jgi:hypothetical protein